MQSAKAGATRVLPEFEEANSKIMDCISKADNKLDRCTDGKGR